MQAKVNSENIQLVWKAINELKPSDKSKITKGDNALRLKMAERNRPSQDAFQVILNKYCPPRDEKIKAAQAKRDAIIAAAKKEYEAARDEAIKEASIYIKPASDNNDLVWKTNYEKYQQEWYELVVSVIGREIL